MSLVTGLWKGIRKGWDDFVACSNLVVGKGSLVEFQFHMGCGRERLRVALPAILSIGSWRGCFGG